MTSTCRLSMIAWQCTPSTGIVIVGAGDRAVGQFVVERARENARGRGLADAARITGVRGVGKTTTARILARALNYELPDGSVAGPDHQDAGARRALPGDHGEPPPRRDRDGRRLAQRRRRRPPDQRRRSATPRSARATRSTSSTKCTCCRRRPSTRCSRRWKSRRRTPSSSSPPPRSARCRSPCCRAASASTCAASTPRLLVEASRRRSPRKEAIEVEPEALALIARAAEGSVRDALSLFDQAIAHAAGPVRAEDVRQMLGLADRARVDRSVRGADARRRRRGARPSCARNTTPAPIPRWCSTDLAEFTHFVTRVKVVPAVADDPSLIEVERARGRAFAEKLSMRVLSRTWQMLLKGIAEVQAAGRPVAAAEMVLVRIAYAADLPTPDEVIRSLDEAAAAPPAPRRGGVVAGDGRSAPRSASAALRGAARRCSARRTARGAGARRRSASLRSPVPEASAAAAGHRPFRGADRARRAEARPRRQARARARRAAGALRGRPARDRAGAERREDAGQRSGAQVLAMDRPALDGGGVGRAGPGRR